MMYEHYEDQPELTEESEADDPTAVDLSNVMYDAIQKQLAQHLIYGNSRCVITPEPVEPPPIPELPVERSETPLIGYRAWHVSRERLWHSWSKVVYIGTWMSVQPDPEPKPEPEGPYRLWSPVQGTEWTGPILRADGKPCPYDPHEMHWQSREDHCHGIYAHTAPDWSDFSTGRAIGKLEATGRVVVHERGFRAEAVRITHLVLSPSLLGTDAKKDLERIYGCDVTYNPEDLL